MKKIAFVLPVLFFLGFINLQANAINKHESPLQEKPIKGKYALVISFISIGGGIDGATYAKVDSLIKNYPKKPAVAVPARRGREGETTLFLKLNELSKSEKKAFIEDVEKIIAGKDLVKIQKEVNIKASQERK